MSEELALFHCDLLLNRRRTSNAFVKHIFGAGWMWGCRTTGIARCWRTTSITPCCRCRGRFFSRRRACLRHRQVDSWAEALSKKRLRSLRAAGNFTEEDLPDWMFIWENDLRRCGSWRMSTYRSWCIGIARR